MTVERQRANVAACCKALAPVAEDHELVISHGNGPQVGLLALQAAAYDEASAYLFDVLGAQTEGMIGYLIEQELGNLLPFEKPLATVLTMTEVDPDDPAFAEPTKFVGPAIPTPTHIDSPPNGTGRCARTAQHMASRGSVANPGQRIFEARPVEWLLEHGCVVICAGGGGIPTMYRGYPDPGGVEAVIDKDRASAVLAEGLGADLLVIATDVDAVYLDWGTPEQRAVAAAHPDAATLDLPAGSMGPKVEAAAAFASATGHPCVIGALDHLPAILAGASGTRVAVDETGLTFR